ncbi:MAG: 2-oxoacid:acceptor oxidoreductase family protein [Zestosphaera sp.]
MKHEILIVGRGGQGVLLLGRILGVAAAKYAGLFATGSETYASETRGGESRVDLIITDNPEGVDFVKVVRASIALFMFPYSLDRYARMLSSDAYVFLNSTYVKEFPSAVQKVFSAPYDEIAERAVGTSRVSNIVALGHMIARTGIMDVRHVESTLKEIVSEKWLETNMKALRAGLEIQ